MIYQYFFMIFSGSKSIIDVFSLLYLVVFSVTFLMCSQFIHF